MGAAMRTRRQETTIQEFCESVYRAIVSQLENAGRTSQAHDPNIRNEVLWHASKLWDGTHPQYRGTTRRSRKRVTELVYKLVTSGEETNAAKQAT